MMIYYENPIVVATEDGIIYSEGSSSSTQAASGSLLDNIDISDYIPTNSEEIKDLSSGNVKAVDGEEDPLTSVDISGFSLAAPVTGETPIDELEYDTYNGTARTFSKIHKIEVPMAALDAAKKYTVHTQRSIYCGPFGGFLGRDISKTTNFKPVDTSDGIQYISFSDIHMNESLATKTAIAVSIIATNAKCDGDETICEKILSLI